MEDESSNRRLGDIEPPVITPEDFAILEERARRVQDLLGHIPGDWPTYRNALATLDEAGTLPSLPSEESGASNG